MNIKMKCLNLLALLLGWSAVQAQNVVSGTIKNEEGTGLPGAAIRVEGSYLGTITNAEGTYRLEGLENGTYTLLISFVGYETTAKEIELSGSAVELNVDLPRAMVMTEEYEVIGTRVGELAPIAHTNVSQEEIEEINLGKDIPYLLQYTPSMVTTSDAGTGIGYTGLRIRGVDQTNINVTINGVAMNDAESHGVFWVDLPDLASSLSDAQIQRGVGTSTNGAGAFGASINLHTKGMQMEPSAEVQVSAGSFNTRKATFQANSGLIKDHWNFSARLSSIESDGYVDRASSDLNSYYLSGGYYGKSTVLKLLVFGGSEVTYQSWNGVDATTLETDRTFNSAGALYDDEWNVVGYYDNEVDDYRQDYVQLHLSQQISEHWTMNLALHNTYGRGFYEQYQQGADYETYQIPPVQIENTLIESSDLISRRWLDNNYSGGIYNFAYQNNKLKLNIGGSANQYDGDHFGEVIWARVASTTEIRHEYYDNNGTKDEVSAYGKVAYEMSDRLTVFGDLQWRSITYRIKGVDKGPAEVDIKDYFSFFNPKAGLTYKMNQKNRLYASYARANREPKRSDYLDAPEDVTPEHEILDDIEFGHHYNSNKFAFNTNFYYMYYTNQLVLTGELNDVGSPIRANSGKSYRTGVELSAALKVGDRLEFLPNFTYSISKNIDYKEQGESSIEDYGNTDLTYSPSIVTGGKLHIHLHKTVTLSLLQKYVGEQYMNNRNTEASKLDAYYVQDLRLAYHKGFNKLKQLEVSLLVYNLFDTEYVSNGYMWGDDPYYYPQAGINFLVGVGLKF